MWQTEPPPPPNTHAHKKEANILTITHTCSFLAAQIGNLATITSQKTPSVH